MHIFWQLLINYGPILLFLALFIYLMRRGPFLHQRRHFERSREYMSEHIAEIKCLNASLERIADALETRNSGPRQSGG